MNLEGAYFYGFDGKRQLRDFVLWILGVGVDQLNPDESAQLESTPLFVSNQEPRISQN
jgi:hypothetical protein